MKIEDLCDTRLEKRMLAIRVPVFIASMCFLVCLLRGMPSAEAGDMVDVNNVAYKVSRLTMGPVIVDCVTGNVEIKEGMKLNEASAGFWQAVEAEFKRNAKIGMRIQVWEEIRTEAVGEGE